MKMVEALIPVHRFDPLKDALRQVGIQGLTVSEVRRFSSGDATIACYRGIESERDFVHEVLIEVAVSDTIAPAVRDTISRMAQLGPEEDRKIRVRPLHGVIRIRTGERGDVAL
jgi:nitrogen regulatory protein P-II 1